MIYFHYNATIEFWIDGLAGSNPSSRPRALQRWEYDCLISSLSSDTSVIIISSFNVHFLLDDALIVRVIIATSVDAGDDPKGWFCGGGEDPLSLPLSLPSLSIAYCRKYGFTVLWNDWVVMHSRFNRGGLWQISHPDPSALQFCSASAAIFFQS